MDFSVESKQSLEESNKNKMLISCSILVMSDFITNEKIEGWKLILQINPLEKKELVISLFTRYIEMLIDQTSPIPTKRELNTK